MGKQKSIVLVTVDCLRADHAGFMGYERPTTPFLDSLATESFVFPNAITAGVPTYYSVPAIIAARYPLALGRDVLGLAPGETSLASVLKQAGYTTASFGADNPYISSRFGYEQGFDTFRDFLICEPISEATTEVAPRKRLRTRLNQTLRRLALTWRPLELVYDELYFRYGQRVSPVPDSFDKLRPYPAADVIVDQACAWLPSAGDTPFFLWLHLMDPHWPYYPREQALDLMGYKRLTTSRARYLNLWWNRSDLGPSRLCRHRDDIVGLYDAGIRWVDAQMARLVESLRAASRWEDCIFAVTADHGEQFLEHGGRLHNPGLMEELIHVPLLMRVPGSPKKGVSPSPFSLLHLAPTLMDAAHVPPSSEFQGRSYWSLMQQGASFDSVAVSECVAGCTIPFHREGRFGSRILSVRDSRFKLIVQFDPPAEQLYDLEADPGEQAPLAPTAQKAVRRRFLEVAREHLRRSIEGRDSEARVRACLRELQLEWARSFPQSAQI